MLKPFILSLGFLGTNACIAMQNDESPQTPERIEVAEELSLDYLVAVPAAHDVDGDPVPVVLFLHGAGERGDDLEKVKA